MHKRALHRFHLPYQTHDVVLIIVDPKIRCVQDTYRRSSGDHVLQIILKADIPVEIRMGYAALAGCHRFWNGPFSGELIVKPLKDGDIILTITVD